MLDPHSDDEIKIVEVQGKYYGYIGSLGQLDFSTLSLDEIGDLQEMGLCWADESLDGLNARINHLHRDPGITVIDLNFHGCLVIKLFHRYYAITRRTKLLDLKNIQWDLIRNFYALGLCVSADNLESLLLEIEKIGNGNHFLARIDRHTHSKGHPTHILGPVDAPWQNRPWKIKDINPINSMIIWDEAFYLYWLASEYYSGSGEIFDGGCLLGGSTHSLAKGVTDNPQVMIKEKRVNSFDLFEFYPDFKARVLPNSKLRQGDSLLPLYLSNIKNFEKIVNVYPGDILSYQWNGQSIEIMFIDLSKSWQIQNHLVKTFFGCLIENRSIVVQQDYFHYFCYWIHLVMEFLSPYFEVVHVTEGASAGFILRKNIPETIQNLDFSTLFTTSQAIALMDRAINRYSGIKQLRLKIAKVHLLADHLLFLEAYDLGWEIRKSGFWQKKLLHDISQAESHLPVTLVYKAISHPEHLVGSSRRFWISLYDQTFYASPLEMDFDVTIANQSDLSEVVKSASEEGLIKKIGESIYPIVEPASLAELGKRKGFNLLYYASVLYAIPIRLGSFNINYYDPQNYPEVIRIPWTPDALKQIYQLIDESQEHDVPELILEKYKGFNIVLYGNHYYGLSTRLGQFNLTQTDALILNRWVDLGLCIKVNPGEDIIAQIDRIAESASPRMDFRDYLGFKIIFYQNRYFALPLELGELDLSSIAINAWIYLVENGNCLIGSTYEEVIGKIDRVTIDWIDQGYKGYQIFRFQQQYFGLSLSLTLPDLLGASHDQLIHYIEESKCFVGSSTSDIIEQIANSISG